MSGKARPTLFGTASQPCVVGDALLQDLQSPETGLFVNKDQLTPVQRKVADDLRVLAVRIATLGRSPKGLVASHPSTLSNALRKVRDDGMVQCYVECNGDPDSVVPAIEKAGGVVELVSHEMNLVQCQLPYDRLDGLAANAIVEHIRLPSYAISRIGSVNSQGDGVHRCDIVRSTKGFTGVGVKVGVISDGIDGIATSQASLDIPATYQAQSARADLDLNAGAEGLTMMEIVHDLAPGAALAFANPGTSAEMVNAINILDSTFGCDIICDDIGFADEPFFEDGPIVTRINTAVANGAAYVSAAGNAAYWNYYEGDYSGMTQTIGGVSKNVQSCAVGDWNMRAYVPAYGYITVVVQWNDAWGASANDYNLYLTNSTGATVYASSTAIQDGNDKGFEVTGVSNGGSGGAYVYVVVEKKTGVDRRLKITSWGDGWFTEYSTTTGSIWGHPAADNAISCGAVPWSSPSTIEMFSSRGPVRIDFPSLTYRNKPDICGVDGVSVTGNGGFGTPFYGTSAAAPHVAGVCAQVWSADLSRTNAQVRRLVQITAVDLGVAGWDSTYGYGRADAVNATAETVNTLTINPPYDYTWSVDQSVADCLSASGGIPPYHDWTAVVGGGDDYTYAILGSSSFSTVGTAKGWKADDDSWPYTLPFTFPFYGSSRTSVNVCSNGFLDFTSITADFSNTSAELISSVRIAPLWDDLVTSSGDIYVDESVSGQVNIRWQGATYSGSYPVNFATVLFSDGRIRFDYGSGNTGLSPTVGISSGNGTQYILVPGYDGASSLTNANSVMFTPTIGPPPLPPGVSLNATTGCFFGAPTTVGDYSAPIQVSDSTLPVLTKQQTFTFHVVPALQQPTSPTATPSTICVGGSSTLSATPGSGGDTIAWYSGSCGGTYEGTGVSLPVSPISTTTYYAKTKNSTTGCLSSSCASGVTVTVNQPPLQKTVTAQDGAVPSATGTNIQVALSEIGVSYQLKTEAGTPVGSPVPGTGSTINLPTGDLTITTQFKVEATCSPCSAVTMTTTHPTVTVDNTPPTVLNVTSEKDDETYGVGAAIDVRVEFSEAVFVTGSPQLLLETGEPDRYAVYTSGDGTDTLVFEYVVEQGDASADLDYVDANALELSGGTIRDGCGNDTDLTLVEPGEPGSLGANKAIVIDTTSPTGSVVINGGAVYTTTQTVTLALSAADDSGIVWEMRISNDGVFDTEAWEAYAASKIWTLGAGDGTKTVYVRYKDPSNNESTTVTATITVDSAAPGISISGPSADVTSAGPVIYTVTYTEADSITLSAADVTLNKTGTANGTVSVTGAGAASRTVATSGITGDGTLGISIAAGSASDSVGNAAPAAGPSASFTVDNIAPSVTITSPTSDPSCTRNASTLNLAGAADDDTGVADVAWSNDHGGSGTCTGTASWSASGITLTEGDNVITVTATDRTGKTGSAAINVTYTPSAPGAAWTGIAMVSLPIIPDTTDPSPVVGFDGNGWYAYNTAAGSYAGYADHFSWFEPVSTTPGRGFWAYFPASGGSAPSGMIPDQTQPVAIRLKPGWNIIGNPFIKPVNWDRNAITVRELSGAMHTLAAARSLVANYAWGWDTAQGQYILVYDPSLIPSAQGALQPWCGYWLKAWVECDLVIPAP